MKKRLPVLVEIIIVGLLVFLLTVTHLFSSLDYLAKDSIYQIPRGINSKIKIIGIDEKTLDEYGPIQTWSRSRYAELLDILNKDENSKPVVIGFDIQFSGNVDQGDSEFAEAAEKSGNVIIVNQLIYSKKGERDKNGVLYYSVEGTAEPYDDLKNAVLNIGFSNMAQDSDGTVRRVIPEETYGNETHYMFSRLLYEEYAKRAGITVEDIPTDSSGRTIINYSGKPGDYECVSMSDVISGRIDSRAFAGSVVLVGAYAPGMQDSFKVPNGSSKQMYGVEIHANILQSYLDGRFAVNGNSILYAFITAILAMLLHLCFRKLKVWQGLLLLICSIAVVIVFDAVMNNKGVIFSVIYFPVVAVLSYVYVLALHYMIEKAKKKKILSAFRKYVAPQIVEEISKKGDFEINLGGENRDIAVLFVDIRGFTTMSEALEPEKVVEILNEYLSLTTKSIFDNSGTLDKFVGDATMAVFNSPFDLPDYEYKAVCAALDIVRGGEELEKVLFEKYGRSVGFGVGVHCGPAVVGNVGCDFRMDFTAIGDTVNTSARLEANAKKGQVLISDVLYERMKDRIEVNEIGQIPLKGKSNDVMVYEVTGLK